MNADEFEKARLREEKAREALESERQESVIADHLIQHFERLLVEKASVEECRHVLWAFGNRELGQEPGDFRRGLFELAARADWDNLTRLGKAFPIVALWYCAKRTDRGMAQLCAKVIAREVMEAVRFGMPMPHYEDAPQANINIVFEDPEEEK